MIDVTTLAFDVIRWLYSTAQGLYSWLVEFEFTNGLTMWEMIQNPVTWVSLLVVWIGIKIVGAFLP